MQVMAVKKAARATAVKTAAVAELADATNASTHLRIAPKAAA
eukprot:SAG31_NODE_45420_length_259_cov_0.606250_1_plen_42_part_00